jgi:hypothetical protein
LAWNRIVTGIVAAAADAPATGSASAGSPGLLDADPDAPEGDVEVSVRSASSSSSLQAADAIRTESNPKPSARRLQSFIVNTRPFVPGATHRLPRPFEHVDQGLDKRRKCGELSHRARSPRVMA